MNPGPPINQKYKGHGCLLAFVILIVITGALSWVAMQTLSGFLIVCQGLVLLWFFFKWRGSRDSINELNSRFRGLQQQLEQLQRAQDAARAAAAHAATMEPPLMAHDAAIREDERLQKEKRQPSLAALGTGSTVTPAAQNEQKAQSAAAEPFAKQAEKAAPAAPPSSAAKETGSKAAQPSFKIPVTLKINWEKVLGVQLFAWVGGLALFLGVAFFVKYSFENNLISPQLRVALGFLFGIGMMIAGLLLPREKNAVTVQTFCATATLILYANIFAAHAYYHFINPTGAFALMALVTVTAFLLSVRLNAQMIAILGLLGGFLTPPLLSTGVDNPVGLFSYIALLDIGLIAVALHRRWNHLVLMAAVSTVVMQAGWVDKFFTVDKVYTGMAVYLGFAALFVGAFAVATRLKQIEKWMPAAALLMPSVALCFALGMFFYNDIANRVVLLFTFVFLVDLAFLAIAWLRTGMRSVHVCAGGAVFFILVLWTILFLTPPLLNAALGFYLLFALLHSVFPLVLQRLRPAPTPLWWVHLYPPLALLLIMIPLFSNVFSMLLWPVVLLVDVLALLLAVAAASMLSLIAVFVLTGIATALWIFHIPPVLPQAPMILLVIGGFAIFFLLVGVAAAQKLLPIIAVQATSTPAALTPQMMGQIAGIAAMLPFLLLTLVLQRLPLADPSPVFGLAALLLLLLLAVVRYFDQAWLTLISLISVLLVEYTWHVNLFAPEHMLVAIAWYLGFSAAFLCFPFLFLRRMENQVVPWAVSALALPLHFFLIYSAFTRTIPNYSYVGLLPAALAAPCMLGLLYLLRKIPAQSPARNTLLALFAGVALFFITLIFPIQFERQWITIGWALEGVALLWLFQRLPHPGLRLSGAALLAVSFVRLALNPWVLSEYSRSGQAIFNWYLYSYGIVAVCMLAGARLLAPPRNLIRGVNVQPVFYAFGVVLAFLLLNIEIADYFSAPGSHLTFNFSGDVAQDMTYSLAWGLFAFALFTVGFKSKNALARYAGMGLLIVTLVKLFFHDLWRLGGLYRIGSFVGLAVLLILISFIYQHFFQTNPLNATVNVNAAAKSAGESEKQ